MSNSSCLTDCLKCQTQQTKHSFKLKNNRKWITLTKNTQKQSQVQQEPIQRQKYQPFIKLYQVPCSKQQNNTNIISRGNNIDSIGSRSSRKSASPNVNNLSVESNHSKVIPRQLKIQSKRVQTRTCSSLDQKKKPIISQRPINFIYDQQNLSRSVSEQKKYTTQNQFKKDNQQSKKQQYLISPIIEQPEQRQKRSSLFQGAKSIVSKLVTSRKQHQVISSSFDPKTVEKPVKLDVQTFYQNVRLCETQHVITFTNSSILTSGEQKKHTTKQLSLDQIPMSPQTKEIDTYSKFKVGRLLGVGKWAHIYLCQQRQTNSIFAIKQIFKESMQVSQSYDKIGKSIDRLISLNSGRLMNIYSKFETKQKLCLLVEYCEKNLFSQLKQKGLFPLQKLKLYSKQIIQALVFLHQNDIIHGNLNIFQVFMNFSECKLKPSIPYNKKQNSIHQNQLKSDIEGLAIIIFEMAHGLVPTLLSVGTHYQKEKLYQDNEMRKKIISFINTKISLPQKDPVYILINDLIKTLLEWNPNCRLMASQCINHKFFALNS